MREGEMGYNPEQEKLNKFSELRKRVHQEIEQETVERIKNNPKPAEEEIFVGAFREMIEPQIRDALFEFNKKGYSTESSGFWGDDGDIQAMDGYYSIDKDTKANIESLGAQVLRGGDEGLPHHNKEWASIRFKTEQPDIDQIKSQWDKIAAILPDRGGPAMPPISGGSEDFRKEYAPHRTDIEKTMLEKRLALEEYDPETEAEMKKRLTEL